MVTQEQIEFIRRHGVTRCPPGPFVRTFRQHLRRPLTTGGSIRPPEIDLCPDPDAHTGMRHDRAGHYYRPSGPPVKPGDEPMNR